MEKEYLIKPILIRYMCDCCCEGEMLPTGNNYWNVNPLKFEHKCSKCGKILMLNEKYPTIRYREE